MIKINLNDICPCNSGKKFRNCCMIECQIQQKKQFPSYPENFVLGKLMSSPQFLHFYQNERGKITQPLYWRELPDNNIGSRAMVGSVLGSDNKIVESIIFLPRIPASLTDQFSVAHEIGHILFDQKNFSGIFPKESMRGRQVGKISYDDAKKLSCDVSSIFTDVQVNSFLSTYGFDWASHLSKDMSQSI